MMPRHRIAALAALVLQSFSTTAMAASGYLKGNMGFWNKNGNYCPTNRDCTGSLYYQSQFDTWQPIRNAQVFVENDSVGIIGQGTTDNNGNYLIAWSYPGSLPNAGATYVWWRPYQKDGRFRVHYSNGTYRWYPTYNFTPLNGTTSASPQDIGGAGWGSSASPDGWANVYWAAEATWRESLNLVGVLQQNFTGLEIRGFADSMPDFLGTCTTSCANGASNQVQLDSGAALAPQGRVMHEMGHIAVYKAGPYTQVGGAYGAYCYPSTSGACGWSFTSTEWGVSTFNEAMATFAADSTLYWPHAPAPHSCLSTIACQDNYYNIETSSYPYATNYCVSGEDRWTLSTMRYLWDVYDSIDDGESTAEGWNYWPMWAVLSTYPAGTEDGQRDEPWNSTYSGLDNYDGRASVDYRNRYTSAVGVNTWLARVNNCSPP